MFESVIICRLHETDTGSSSHMTSYIDLISSYATVSSAKFGIEKLLLK